MGKFIAGMVVATLVALALGGFTRSRTPKLVTSESFTLEVPKGLEETEKTLFDANALEKHGVFLLQDSSVGSLRTSFGVLEDISGDYFTTGRLVEPSGEAEDPRAALLSNVQKLIRQGEENGFVFLHNGFRCFSFGGGMKPARSLLMVSYGGTGWSKGSRLEPADRFVGVYIRMVFDKNPSIILNWDLIFDTQERLLSLHRWMQGRHPIQYSSENWSTGKLSLSWKGQEANK